MDNTSYSLRLFFACVAALTALLNTADARQRLAPSTWEVSHVILAPAGDDVPGRSVLWIGVTNHGASNRMICVSNVSIVVDEPGHGYSQDAGPHGCNGFGAFTPVLREETYFVTLDRDSSVFSVPSSSLTVEISLLDTNIANGLVGNGVTAKWSGTVIAARDHARSF